MDPRAAQGISWATLVQKMRLAASRLDAGLAGFLATADGSLWAAAAAVAAAIGLSLRNLALPSPIMSGDEYIYYTAARGLRNLSAYAARDPYLQLVGAPMLPSIGRIFFKLSGSPELLMKLFNALAFASCVLLAGLLLARLSRNRFAWYAPLLMALLPFSAYSAYFMPETLYVLLFLGTAVTLILLLPRNDRLACGLAGFLVGMLMLTKPNGIAIFAAGVMTLLSLWIAPRDLRWSWKRVLTDIALFSASTYLSEVAVHALLVKNVSWSPLLFVGSYYAARLQPVTFTAPSAIQVGVIATNLVGHLIAFLFLCAIPLAYLGRWLVRAFRSGSASAEEAVMSERVYIMAIFAPASTAISMAMTLIFTVSAAGLGPLELLRLHGRYYTFVLFLYLAAYFALRQGTMEGTRPARVWRLWSMIGLGAALLMFWVQRVFWITPWDYPDLMSMSLWNAPHWPATAVVAIGVLVYAAILWKPALHRSLYPALLCVLFVAAQGRVIGWQFHQPSGFTPLSSDGRAIRQLMPEAERDRGVVIGNSRNQVAYFLFGFSSNPYVRQLPAGAEITEDDLPPDIDWIILLDHYALKVPVQTSVHLERLWIDWLSPASPGAN